MAESVGERFRVLVRTPYPGVSDGLLTFSVFIVQPRTGLIRATFSRDISNYVNGSTITIFVTNITLGEFYFLSAQVTNHFGNSTISEPISVLAIGTSFHHFLQSV